MTLITIDAIAVLNWAADHLNAVFSLALLGLVWRFRGSFDKYFSDQKMSADKIAETLTAVESAKRVAADSVKIAVEEGAKRAQELQARIETAQIKIEATAAAVQKIDQNDLAHLAEGLNKKWTEQGEATRDMLAVLTSIDTNTKILADRGLGSSRRRK